ncbi:CLUMA_CG011684, isoform A [Clunio marinus]|uniref:CLUMA_CG011684, isoform A n=1 Tax=Clunio marinus TaxID=568069 RepID=A0A1J1IEX9_9DIPT|nr:CLUMA_CG011684, isoform A [Clunio marinus]
MLMLINLLSTHLDFLNRCYDYELLLKSKSHSGKYVEVFQILPQELELNVFVWDCLMLLEIALFIGKPEQLEANRNFCLKKVFLFPVFLCEKSFGKISNCINGKMCFQCNCNWLARLDA